MHIMGIKANNFMRLGLIELNLDGKNLIIGGKNEQGKSSLLNAFWVALGGSDAMDTLEISAPVRKGETRADIELDLGDIVIARKWIINPETDPAGKSPNMYLEVKTKEGAKYPSPQKMLDALVGKMFDPFEFSEMKSKDQREMLLKLVDLGAFSIEENAAARKAAFEERTAVNREVARLTATLKGKPIVDAPDEEVSTASVLEEMRAAQAVKEANDSKRRDLTKAVESYNRVKKDIANAEATISDLEHQLAMARDALALHQGSLASVEERGGALNKEVKALVDPDLSIFDDKLRNLEDINGKVRAKRERNQLGEELAKVQAEADALTEKIKTFDQAKEWALKAAKFPVEGLSIDEDGITFNGIPLGQCSTEEKMRVCVAIAMATSPKLKVIRISRAESLDADNFKVIQEMAAAAGYQLLMEKVGDPGEMGIIIENGSVKSAE